MTNELFSDSFDTLVSSYRRFKDFDDKEILDSIEFNEFEKSLYLTLALEEVIINLYNGKNPYDDSFESTEETRRYLDNLILTKLYQAPDSDMGSEDNIDTEEEPSESTEDTETIEWTTKTIITPVSTTSKFFKLPENLAFITYEQVTFDDESLGCFNGQNADVYPVTQDEYNRISRNPFRGATKRRVLRMDTGDSIVELISKYNISRYLIKYLSKPSPIILVDLPEDLEIGGISEETPCKLNEILHNTILKRAVQIALTSKSINTKDNSDD